MLLGIHAKLWKGTNFWENLLLEECWKAKLWLQEEMKVGDIICLLPITRNSENESYIYT